MSCAGRCWRSTATSRATTFRSRLQTDPGAMDLLLDIFGFASVLLSGVVRTFQCLTLGGLAFLVLIAVPLDRSATRSEALVPRTMRLARIFAWGLLVSVMLLVAMQVTILSGTAEISVVDALGGDFAVAQLVRIAGAILLLVLLHRRNPAVPLLVAFGLIDLGAGVPPSHAMARVDARAL